MKNHRLKNVVWWTSLFTVVTEGHGAFIIWLEYSGNKYLRNLSLFLSGQKLSQTKIHHYS